MKLEELIQYVVGIMVIGAVASSLIRLLLYFVPAIMAFAFVCIPLYGIYKTKHGTKGLTQILSKNQKHSKKLVGKKKKDYTALFITGFTISLIFGDLVLTLAKVLIFSSVALFVVAAVWESARYLFKTIAKKNVLSFIEAVGLAL